MPVFFEQFGQDLSFGFRSFRKTPGLTIFALLSLALGIGATTVIFSTVYSAILNPFPYGDVQRLFSAQIQQASGTTRYGFTSAEFLDLVADGSEFLTAAGSRWSEVSLTGREEPERLDGVYATANLFDVLKVRPLLGRGFLAGDSRPDAPDVAVLSYKCWQRLFAGDVGVIGKEVRINNQVRTVVGVMPERVYWLDADVYMPVAFERYKETSPAVLIVGRLKNDLGLVEGEAKLNGLFRTMALKEPEQFPTGWRAQLISFPDSFPSTIKNELWMLLSAVGLLLLIACANVSSLLLSKASGREKEMAIRASVGAGRGRMMRQLLTESLLLALLGCGLGLLFAWQGLHLLLARIPQYTIPGEAKIGLSAPILWFSLAVSGATAILAGLAPALHASREQLSASLQSTTRGASGGRKQTAARQWLVIGEVALSLVLLMSAALMLRTLFALQKVPLGISTDKVLTMDVPLSTTRYKTPVERVLVLKRYLEAIRGTTGVVAASLNTNLHPFENLRGEVKTPGNTSPYARQAMIQQVDSDYFRVFRIAMVNGRAWTDIEMAQSQRLVLVNRTFERLYLAGHPALGAKVEIPAMKSMFGAEPFQIIGVTSDALNQGLSKTAAPEIYLPYTLTGSSRHLAIRTSTDPLRASHEISTSIRRVNEEQLITNVMTMNRALEQRLLSLSQFQLVLFGLFACIGFALAIAGIYGVISNTVESRARELGIRLALGAQPEQVIRLVLHSGLRMVLPGIGIGLAGALLLTRFMTSFLFGIRAADPLSFAAVTLVLSAAGIAACLEPAIRAARIDPVCSLRQE